MSYISLCVILSLWSTRKGFEALTCQRMCSEPFIIPEYVFKCYHHYLFKINFCNIFSAVNIIKYPTPTHTHTPPLTVTRTHVQRRTYTISLASEKLFPLVLSQFTCRGSECVCVCACLKQKQTLCFSICPCHLHACTFTFTFTKSKGNRQPSR